MGRKPLCTSKVTPSTLVGHQNVQCPFQIHREDFRCHACAQKVRPFFSAISCSIWKIRCLSKNASSSLSFLESSAQD